MLLNIHTHRPCPEGEQTIPAFGLHPWNVAVDWETRLSEAFASFPSEEPDGHPASFFIGECGLDRLCDAPYTLQLQAFEAQIAFSNRLARPLILHCVRALDDVLRLHHHATQPWIWHGFRGKPELLAQLVRAGFYISFGWRYNPESLLACPAHRLFLETDDGPETIAPLYRQVAVERATTVEALATQTWHNLLTLTAKRKIYVKR